MFLHYYLHVMLGNYAFVLSIEIVEKVLESFSFIWFNTESSWQTPTLPIFFLLFFLQFHFLVHTRNQGVYSVKLLEINLVQRWNFVYIFWSEPNRLHFIVSLREKSVLRIIRVKYRQTNINIKSNILLCCWCSILFISNKSQSYIKFIPCQEKITCSCCKEPDMLKLVN